MEVGSDDLEEVVVTGYGSQRKATVTGAITAVKGENITKSPAVNLTNTTKVYMIILMKYKIIQSLKTAREKTKCTTAQSVETRLIKMNF